MAAEELENKSIKQLKRLQDKIEQEIEAKTQTKESKRKLYDSIKNDFAQHRRSDGRKTQGTRRPKNRERLRKGVSQ